jgi:hypothetical protein
MKRLPFHFLITESDSDFTEFTNNKWILTAFCAGPGWNVTVYVPTTMGGLFDFPWNPSARQAVSNANVPYLFYYNNIAKDFPGTPADDFALIAAGNIYIPAGQHLFCIYSAGGSWLFVDGRLFMNNYYSYYYSYYNYYPSVGNCQYFWLEAGIHTITVNYFKHTGAAALELYMDGSLITVLNGELIGLYECF